MTRDRSELTRQQILDAAMVCFARSGYERTSTATIARQAGVSQGLIFHHFDTKEGLFSAVVRTGIDQLQACLVEAGQSELGPPERLQLTLRLMGELALANPALSDIIIRQVLSMQLDPEKAESLGLMEGVAGIRAVFEEGKRAGIFGDIDTQTAAFALIGIYLGNYIGWSASGRSYDFVHSLRRACSMFLDGVSRPA